MSFRILELAVPTQIELEYYLLTRLKKDITLNNKKFNNSGYKYIIQFENQYPNLASQGSICVHRFTENCSSYIIASYHHSTYQ